MLYTLGILTSDVGVSGKQAQLNAKLSHHLEADVPTSPRESVTFILRRLRGDQLLVTAIYISKDAYLNKTYHGAPAAGTCT